MEGFSEVILGRSGIKENFSFAVHYDQPLQGAGLTQLF